MCHSSSSHSPSTHHAVTTDHTITCNGTHEFRHLQRSHKNVLRTAVFHSTHQHAVCLTARPQFPTKRVLQPVPSSAASFNFQYLCIFLTVVQKPLTSSSSSSSHFYIFLYNVFYKAVHTQGVTNPSSYRTQYVPSPHDFATLPHFSHVRPT